MSPLFKTPQQSIEYTRDALAAVVRATESGAAWGSCADPQPAKIRAPAQAFANLAVTPALLRIPGAAGAEALLDTVPVGDLRLPQLPAEIDRLLVEQGGKIDQAQIDVFDDASMRLDPVDQAADFVLQLREARRRQRRADARQPGPAEGFRVVERRISLEQLDGKLPPPVQQFLDERSELSDEGVGTFRRKEFHMGSLRIVFVTGLSGAGLSQAIKSFEDLGFYCIEHLPPVVLESALVALQNSAVRDVAIALDVRSDGHLGDARGAIDRISNANDVKVLFLDASDELLVRRFSETRRRHPLLEAGSVREAIDADRRALASLRECADVVLDTTNLTHGALKDRIARAFVSDGPVRLAVTFLSFGFKFGVPTDLDLLFDVRFLRNPNYEEHLAPLTGSDPEVGAFIEGDPSLEPFLSKVTDLLQYLLPRYRAEGKTQLTVGFGCTGGRHRSVYVARRVMLGFRDDARLTLKFEARELGGAA